MGCHESPGVTGTGGKHLDIGVCVLEKPHQMALDGLAAIYGALCTHLHPIAALNPMSSLLLFMQISKLWPSMCCMQDFLPA